METKIKIVRTPGKRTPALWEEGGATTSKGRGVIITDEKGNPPLAIYITRRGPRACGQHALVPIREGMHIIKASISRGYPERIEVFKISSIEESEATLSPICRFEMGEWDVEPPSFLSSAIESALGKANSYHCREPHYVVERYVGM